MCSALLHLHYVHDARWMQLYTFCSSTLDWRTVESSGELQVCGVEGSARWRNVQGTRCEAVEAGHWWAVAGANGW